MKDVKTLLDIPFVRVLLAILIVLGLLYVFGCSRSNTEAEEMPLDLYLAPAKQTILRGEAIKLTWTLANNSPNRILVLSHFATNGHNDFDQVELTLTRKHDNEIMHLSLISPRKAAAKVFCLLDPGETISNDLDLPHWLTLNYVDIGVGSYEVVAIYHVSVNEAPVSDWMRCRDIMSESDKQVHSSSAELTPWSGEIKSRPIEFQISG
jgi:hypothetical protein